MEGEAEDDATADLPVLSAETQKIDVEHICNHDVENGKVGSDVESSKTKAKPSSSNGSSKDEIYVDEEPRYVGGQDDQESPVQKKLGQIRLHNFGMGS